MDRAIVLESKVTYLFFQLSLPQLLTFIPLLNEKFKFIDDKLEVAEIEMYFWCFIKLLSLSLPPSVFLFFSLSHFLFFFHSLFHSYVYHARYIPLSLLYFLIFFVSDYLCLCLFLSNLSLSICLCLTVFACLPLPASIYLSVLVDSCLCLFASVGLYLSV